MCAACRNITPLAPTSFEPAPRTIVAALSTCDEVQQPTRKTLHPSCLHLMSINSPSILTLRLSTIRAKCQAATQATSDQVAGELTEPPLLASRKGSCPLASWMCCCQRRIIWRLLAARLRKQMQRQAHTASNTATIGTV